MAVVLRERKKFGDATERGDDCLFGNRLLAHFPLRPFQSKWARRVEREPDDGQAAPRTWGGIAWGGVEDHPIPWAALKRAWRRAAPMICPNCDTPMMLVNFGLRPAGIFSRSPHFVSVCGACRKWFMDETVKDVPL